jgi:hypothetical protein
VTEPTQKLLVALHKAIDERFKIIQGQLSALNELLDAVVADLAA